MRIAHGARCYSDGVDRLQTNCDDWQSVTRQDQALFADINHIYKRTQLGEMPIGSSVPPEFGDFTNVQDYSESLNFILKANEAFMELPAEMRREYDDDAGKWYEATVKNALEAHNSAKAEEAATREAQAKQKALSDAQALISANQNNL